jgi:hypothetical protein
MFGVSDEPTLRLSARDGLSVAKPITFIRVGFASLYPPYKSAHDDPHSAIIPSINLAGSSQNSRISLK